MSEAIDQFDAEVVIAVFDRAVEAMLGSRYRERSIVRLPGRGRLLVTGALSDAGGVVRVEMLRVSQRMPESETRNKGMGLLYREGSICTDTRGMAVNNASSRSGVIARSKSTTVARSWSELRTITPGEMTGSLLDGDHFIDNDLRLSTLLIGAADEQNDRTLLNVLGEAGENV